MAIYICDHFAVRDRYIAAGAEPIDLYAGMVPPGMPTPASCTVTFTSGTSGHWDKSGGLLSASSAGDAADLSSGTYIATVVMTFAPYDAPNNTATGYVTIWSPADSRYVDPDTGSDAAAGSKAAPWAHCPGDPNATGLAAAFNPGVMTLIVHKDGKLIRSQLTARNNVYPIGKQGWGSSGRTWYTGADPLGAGVAATSGEVFGNPRVANIKKYVAGFTPKMAQWPIDRNAPQEKDGLVQWAQWPAAGADPYLLSFGIARGEVEGMYRVPASCFVANGAASTFQPPVGPVLDSFNAEFASADVTGAYIGFTSTEGSFVNWFPITGYDATAKRVTFDIGANIVKAASDGLVAVQICGHPRSIKGPGQFARLHGSSSYFIEAVDGTQIEVMNRKTGCDFTGSSGNGVAYLGFDGYYCDTLDTEGSAIAGGKSVDWRFDAVGNEMRWLVSKSAAGAAYREIGVGVNTDSIVQGNQCRYTIGTALLRTGAAQGAAKFRMNYGIKFSATAFYIPRIGAGVEVIGNLLVDGYGPHANGMSFYSDPRRAKVWFNTVRDFVRPLTVQDDTSGLAFQGIDFQGNRWIRDPYVEDGARIYGPRHTFLRDMFLRSASKTGVSDRYSLSVSAGATCTFDQCIIDGMIGGQDATFTNCLKAGESWYDPVAIQNNVAPNSGNTYEPSAWGGTVPPRWKQVVGVGNSGAEYLYGIAVIPGLTNVTNAPVSTDVETAWLGPVSADYLCDIVLTNCQMRTNTSASDTGASAYTATPGNDVALNGKYVRFKLTTTSAYATDNVATIDLGNGNVYGWTVRTALPSGWPMMNIDTADWWKFATTTPIANADTKYMTLAYAGRIDSTLADVWFGGYAGGGARTTINTLAPGRFRFSAKDSGGVERIGWDSPAGTYAGQDVTILMTVDTSQPNAAAGVKVYINGTAVASAIQTTWTQDFLIGWNSFMSALNLFGECMNGTMGMFFLDNRLADISDPAVRDKFTALRIGLNGENVFGTAPAIFLVGSEADWENVGGLNRGYSAKMVRQSGTDITPAPGGSLTWPSYTYASALALSGPEGQVGVARTYTVSANGALANPLVITLSDGGKGGAFSGGGVVTLDPATGPSSKTFTYTPAVAGGIDLAATASGVTAAALHINAAPASATAYTFTGASPGALGVAQDLTITLNGANLLGLSIAFDLAGVTGVFSANPVLLTPGETSKVVQFTPTSTGVATITPDNAEGLTNPAALAITIPSSVVVANPTRGRLGLGLSLGL